MKILFLIKICNNVANTFGFERNWGWIKFDDNKSECEDWKNGCNNWKPKLNVERDERIEYNNGNGAEKTGRDSTMHR